MLALIAAIFHLIGGLVFAFAGALIAGMGFFTPFGMGAAALGGVFIALAVIFVVLAFLGAFWMYSGDKTRTTYGGVTTLVIAIIAFPTLWGFFIGSLLGFIGGILGLVWNPAPMAPAPMAAAPTPAPEMPAAESEEPSEE